MSAEIVDQIPQNSREKDTEVTVRLKPETLLAVDRLRQEFGLKSHGDVISRLLDQLFLEA